MVKWLVDRIHVSTPDKDVEADFRKRCAKARKKGNSISPEQEQAIVDEALARHHENQQMYVDVMSGNIG